MPSCPAQGLALLAATVCSLLTVLPAGSSAAQPVPAVAAVDDTAGARVIVRYKAQSSLMRALSLGRPGGSGPQHAATLALRHGLALTDGRIIDRHIQVLRGGPGISSAALAARLAADADVEFAVPDRRVNIQAVPNDPLFAASAAISPVVGQWYLHAPQAPAVSAINAVGAWDISTGSAAVVVADIDTGVLPNHPDLVGKLYPGYDFVSDLVNAGDGNAADADATDPGDWAAANECGPGQPATTSSWHGTQTSSLIGAHTDNAVGMASVGYNVMLLPVRALGKCGGFESDIIAAMLWAGGVSDQPNPHPARVLNLSLGGKGSCGAAYQGAVDQLTAAGVTVVVSAGNDRGLAVSAPANCAGAIAVAGVRHIGTKVGFSSVGPEVTLSAPGGNCVNSSGACLFPIVTATNTGLRSASAAGYTYSDSVHPSFGTSFAAPLVAGTAALMLSVNPALTPAQLKDLLSSSARPFPSSSSDPAVLECHVPDGRIQDECLCTSSTCGAGLLDAAAAVSAARAAGGGAPPPASAPIAAGGTGSGSSGGGAMHAGWLAALALAVLALARCRRRVAPPPRR
jgi:serine protease